MKLLTITQPSMRQFIVAAIAAVALADDLEDVRDALMEFAEDPEAAVGHVVREAREDLERDV